MHKPPTCLPHHTHTLHHIHVTCLLHATCMHITCTLEQANEKMGYLNKMGPENKKRYNRRWFVLKGSELKYYRSHKDLKRPRGVIKLDSWCKLSKLKSLNGFELATPQKIYQLVAKNEHECSDWLTGII